MRTRAIFAAVLLLVSASASAASPGLLPAIPGLRALPGLGALPGPGALSGAGALPSLGAVPGLGSFAGLGALPALPNLGSKPARSTGGNLLAFLPPSPAFVTDMMSGSVPVLFDSMEQLAPLATAIPIPAVSPIFANFDD